LFLFFFAFLPFFFLPFFACTIVPVPKNEISADANNKLLKNLSVFSMVLFPFESVKCSSNIELETVFFSSSLICT